MKGNCIAKLDLEEIKTSKGLPCTIYGIALQLIANPDKVILKDKKF
jgi:hypothetical protein